MTVYYKVTYSDGTPEGFMKRALIVPEVFPEGLSNESSLSAIANIPRKQMSPNARARTLVWLEACRKAFPEIPPWGIDPEPRRSFEVKDFVKIGIEGDRPMPRIETNAKGEVNVVMDEPPRGTFVITKEPLSRQVVRSLSR